MAEETRFHITRLRSAAVGGLYFDPETDIRKLLPRTIEYALELMESEYEGSEHEEDVRYLHDCCSVFHLRLMEDRAPVDRQLGEFLSAISEIPKPLRDQWFGLVVDGLIAVYALFCRRDAPTDASALEALMETSRLSLYKDLLSDTVYNQLQNDLRTRASLLVSNKVNTFSEAIVEETGEHLTELKELACRSMHVSGNNSWDAIAAKCDEGLSNSVGKSDRENIALALAYPVYRKNPLTVELATNEHKGEVDQTANSEQSGDV